MGLGVGTEESKVVLLLALLPNVRELYLQGMNPSESTLEFVAPLHQFEALRRVAIRYGKPSKILSIVILIQLSCFM